VRTLYRNGVVHARAAGPVTAFLVEDARIAWLGAQSGLGAVLDAADEVVDLGGAFVAPGFVDAHAHVLETGFALAGVDLSSAPSLAVALDLIALAARGGSEPVLGHGWDETAWPERRGPTRSELDRATEGAVAYISRADLHSAVVSSALADRAHCADAEGWHEDGTVTGEAHHRARTAVREPPADRREALHQIALTAMAAAGVVSVHEHSAPFLDTHEGLAWLIAATADARSGLPGVVGYRAELCVTTDDARGLLDAVPGLTGIGGDLNVDGSLGSRTAALRAPYTDGDGAERGVLSLTAGQVANHVASVTRAGAQAAFHVIGDRAMDEVLLGFQAAADVEGFETIRAARHRLEHAEMVDAGALARIVLLGLTVSAQPAFDAAWGGPAGMYARRLGPTRSGGMNPFADLLDAGVPLALGSDSPVTPVDPWGGVRAAAEHQEHDERLTLEAAFRAHTVGGWDACRRRGEAGELTVGAPASFAVWEVARYAQDESAPPWRKRPEQPSLPLPDLGPGVPDPVCVRTVRDGVVIYDGRGSAVEGEARHAVGDTPNATGHPIGPLPS
jgi:hypothetical protein